MLRKPSLSLRTLHRWVAARTGAFALFIGLAGGVWGLGLARALAESYPKSPTFELGPTLVLVLAAAIVGVVVALCLASCKTNARDKGSPYSAFVPLFLVLIYVFWPGVAPYVGWTLLGGSLALAGLLHLRHSRRVTTAVSVFSYHRLVALFLAFVTLSLYLRTLGPSVGQADTFEFQVVAPTLGVAHPTGYPLYILSGKLFSLLPFGSVAWRVNLTSAVFGTAAVVFLYLLVYRLTGRPLVALMASLAFAFSQVFWSQAVVAEVYALHNMFVAMVLLLLFGAISGRWRFAHAPRDGQLQSRAVGVGGGVKRAFNPLYVLALVLGLSFANHLTTALLLPAFAVTFLFLRPRMSWRQWLVAAGLFLLGLTLYAYIYFRWPVLHDGVWMSPAEFWGYVTGQQFGGALRLDAWRTDTTRYQIAGRLLRQPFGWPGLVLGAVGLAWLTAKNWRVALITLLTFLAYLWYALSYYVADVAVFLLPAHLTLAVWLGLGVAVILSVPEFLARRASRARLAGRNIAGAFRSILILLFALLPLWLLWTNLPLVDQSGEKEAYAWGDRILDLPIAREAAVLADSLRIAPLYYLQRIEGRRPDLDLLVLADEATYRAELEARLAAGQDVYLARFLPGLEGRYHLRSLGPLTEVSLGPTFGAPLLDRALGVRFGPADEQARAAPRGTIELLGITGPVPGPDSGTGLTLYWRAHEPIGEVYHVKLRLVDDEGKVWWQEDGRHVANNYYPTPAWIPSEVVADYHEIPPTAIDRFSSPSGYTVQAGLFRPFSNEGLSAEGGETWYPVANLNLSVPPDQPAPIHLLRARFFGTPETPWPWRDSSDRLTLVGIDLPDVVPVGSLVELRLHAVAPGPVATTGSSDDAAFQGRPVLTWRDSRGIGIEAPIVEYWGLSRLLVQAPTFPGDYELRLTFVDPQDRSLPARCGWLARASEGCVLANVHVTGATQSALANFDGKMLLLNADFDLPELSDGSLSPLPAGQNVPLTLHWQGLQSMDEDYTVSVQLVGPDGRLHGQTDRWPVQGTLPTSQWSPGQRVADPYQVVLDPDAPPGRYQLGVVVYLLETETRLPLVDEAGQTTGNIFWVAEFEVLQ